MAHIPASTSPGYIDSEDLSDTPQDESLAEDEVTEPTVDTEPYVEPSVHERLAHEQTVNEFLSPLRLDEAKLHRLACRFSTVYTELALNSQEQFLPTPVTKLPNGHETGRYLAIDVGGSNLRVSFIELMGNSSESPTSQRSRNAILKARRERVKRSLERAWPIGEHLKKDNADVLFSWIGDCIAEVVAESLASDSTKNKIPEELDMGITFSFPIM